MRMLIVLGDSTTAGGQVITGCDTYRIEGKPVARIGDRATCPLHGGDFPIITGHPTIRMGGKSVVRHGDKLACGCAVLAGEQTLVSVDDRSEAAATAPPLGQTDAHPVQVPPAPTEVCEECLLAATAKGTSFLER